jgi:flagellar motor switch protein FliN/FliY
MTAPVNTLTPANLEILMNVPVNLTVELGSCRLPMRDVLQFEIGSVVELEKPSDQTVDLLVNDKRVAKGEVVVVENRFGIRITELLG